MKRYDKINKQKCVDTYVLLDCLNFLYLKYIYIYIYTLFKLVIERFMKMHIVIEILRRLRHQNVMIHR